MTTTNEARRQEGRGADVALRPLARADAPRIQALVADERIARWSANIEHPYPEGGARRFLDKAMRLEAAGEARFFAILLDDDLVGGAGFGAHPDGTLHVGYWVGVEWWGRGVATKAMALLLGEAARWRPGVGFTALVTPGNAGSVRVLEKSGFVLAGTAMSPAPARGGDVEVLRFLRAAGAEEAA
ncbi:MAG: GNAT family N-acetyltransferase [Flavobacteriaceae bacterium]